MTRIEEMFAGLLMLSGIAGAAQLTNGSFKVELTPEFPGVASYEYAGETVTLPKNATPVVRLNGKDYTPTIQLLPASATEAQYKLTFKDLNVSMIAKFVVGRDCLTITIEDVVETGTFAVRTIEIPGLVLVSGVSQDGAAIGNFPAPSYASEKPEDHDLIGKIADLSFKDNEKNKQKNCDALGNRGASYVFVSNGKIASGLYTNVMDENLRMIVKLAGEGEQRTLVGAPGKWTYREIPTEKITPVAKLVVAKDNNADKQVTWQDAAITYRKQTPRAYGSEQTKDYPIAHIAMNFASQATNPFLRVLDNAKKVWLNTDGLGQRIQQKGFAGEGHDSSHPDYAGNVGEKVGGREDLNFVTRRGHDFNVKTGVHINAHEYHQEAKWFSPDIVDMNAVGWAWLDESYLTDYRYDSAYGSLYKRLDAMREDLPFLDFAYLDVYYGRGWPGWRMHSKTASLGIMQFTEFPGVMERGVIWNHVGNDWTQQVWGKGDRSEIARFIYFSQKDTFKHDPLLRGTNCDGFMGWHAERSYLQTIKSAFTVNLPTKYLQHSELIRQEKNQAWFSNGTRVESDGSISKMYGRDGQLINSCRYEKEFSRPIDSLSFIPWNPNTEDKIYHWNDKGGDSTWDLPKSWAGITSAELYQLTDTGRVFLKEVPIENGKVTLTGIEANTAYVLYRETPPALPDMKWGEGGLVRDPGFDSHTFGSWTPSGSVKIENEHQYGQTELVMAGKEASSVRQTIEKLVPGQTYAASAWVSIEGERSTSLTVEAAPVVTPPFTDKLAWKTSSNVKNLGKDKLSQIFDGKEDTLWHSADLKDSKTPAAVTVAFGKPQVLNGFIQTCRSDKANGAIKGYLAETSTDGKTWTTVSKGEFKYGEGTVANVPFTKPVTANYFRLTSQSTLNGSTFASIAELDFMMPSYSPGLSKDSLSVSNTIQQTKFVNFTDQSSKYERNWHRLKVVFTAPEDGRADLVLSTAEGSSKVTFDDVRLVKTKVSQAPKGAGKVVLFEDFENCDEGWGPFMYGWHGPMNTHLSETNAPYTWDTISGKFSLKSRLEDSPNLLYRTVPASLKLKPNTTYKVSFDYMSDKADAFAFYAGSDSQTEIKPSADMVLKDGSKKVKKFTTSFKTDDKGDWYVGITKMAKDNKGTVIIDNFLITE